MDSTHQVLAYADDVNLLGNYIRTIEKKADVLLSFCKDIGLAVNTGKIKKMEVVV
jgi:Reverse transcriptase (RNA-dependent DNA polymerase).